VVLPSDGGGEGAFEIPIRLPEEARPAFNRENPNHASMVDETPLRDPDALLTEHETRQQDASLEVEPILECDAWDLAVSREELHP
jgi:hypothetical protein